MNKIFRNIRTNWKTSLAGALSIAAASGATISGAPIDVDIIMQLVSGVGFILAKDSSVTGVAR